jgi:hypothetical protein
LSQGFARAPEDEVHLEEEVEEALCMNLVLSLHFHQGIHRVDYKDMQPFLQQ